MMNPAETRARVVLLLRKRAHFAASGALAKVNEVQAELDRMGYRPEAEAPQERRAPERVTVARPDVKPAPRPRAARHE